MFEKVSLDENTCLGEGREVASLMLPTFFMWCPTVRLLVAVLERNDLNTWNDKLGEKLTKLPCWKRSCQQFKTQLLARYYTSAWVIPQGWYWGQYCSTSSLMVCMMRENALSACLWTGEELICWRTGCHWKSFQQAGGMAEETSSVSIALYIGWNNAVQQYRLETDWLESKVYRRETNLLFEATSWTQDSSVLLQQWKLNACWAMLARHGESIRKKCHMYLLCFYHPLGISLWPF